MKTIIYLILSMSIFATTIERFNINIPDTWKLVHTSPETTSINSKGYQIGNDLLVEVIDTELRKIAGVKKLLNINEESFVTNVSIGSYRGKLYQKLTDEELFRSIIFRTNERAYMVTVSGSRDTYKIYEEEIKAMVESLRIEWVSTEHIEAESKVYYSFEIKKDFVREKNIDKLGYIKRDIYILSDESQIEILVSIRDYDNLEDDVYWTIEDYSSDVHINERIEALDVLNPYIKLTYLYKNKEKRVHWFMYNNQMLIEFIYQGSLDAYKKDKGNLDSVFDTFEVINE